MSWEAWAYFLRPPGGECFPDDFCFLAGCFAGEDEDLPRAFFRSSLVLGARLVTGEGGFALAAAAAAAAAFSRRAFS